MRLPIQRFTVIGSSMNPTLKQGQDILSFNWAYLGRKPKAGDVVVIKVDQQEIVKRVRKIEGEKILVQGDNKSESTDSRHFGPINLNQIVGKVIYQSNETPCPNCESLMVGISGRKDATCGNCGFKLTCCGEP